ncbi:MAG: serpin family protein [Lachnospiraceae bacterium]|nr:serpin family protein [Lachnospiraceae bacterium]
MTNDKIFIENYQSIVRNLLGENLKETPLQNIVISPYSILYLLSIVALSTDNNTKDEITQFLSCKQNQQITGYSDCDDSCTDSSGDFCDYLLSVQRFLDECKELSVSNAICAKSLFSKSIKKEFVHKLSKQHKCNVFASDHVADDVNKWVKKNTKGMINSLLDPSADFNACFLNAIAFISEWATPYENDDIYEDDFTNADGTVSTVEMLRSTEKKFVVDENFYGFVKDYKNNNFSFMALLPKNKANVSLLIKSLEKINFTKLYSQSSRKKVYVTMPEFKYSFSNELTDFCKRHGINELFTPAADFSPMCSAPLMADSILHKAYIELDRKGTKAAAVTGMVVVAGCAPMMEDYKEVILDRPFVYAIIHNKTGLPIFTGITNKL